MPGSRHEPTVADSPVADAARGLASDAGSTSVATRRPVREEQLARGRGMARLALVLGAIGTIGIAIPGPRDWDLGRHLSTAAGLAITIGAAWLMYALRRPDTPYERKFTVGIAIMVPLVGVMTVYIGVFSPAVAIYILVIYVAALSDYPRLAWASYVVTTAVYLVVVGLVIFEVVPGEKAIFATVPIDPLFDAVPMVAFVIAAYTMTFWFARMSRRATVQAMAELDHAQQKIRRRDIMLDEARNALDEAMGNRGLMSGREVGPYALDRVLGRGGMGEVYEAVHVHDGSAAAVKVMHPSLLDADHVARFLREVEITTGLKSPHLVEVKLSGKTAEGVPYLAMELLEGHDLAWHLRNRATLPHDEVVRMVTATARALSVAHRAGVVHRDLKPQNLFLTRAGHWKVLDFGVSKLRGGAGTITQGRVVGTPGYMAPEQATGQEVDQRADVFSLGAIAYRALTGRPAFSGGDPLATMYQIVQQQPFRPSSVSSVGTDVDEALAIALSKEPAGRFDSASAFATALSDALVGALEPSCRTRATEILRSRPWRTESEGDELPTRADGVPS